MKKVLLINAHLPIPPSKGKLNESIFDIIKDYLVENGVEIKVTHISKGYDATLEIEKHLWADIVITQSPVFWFSTPWSHVKYISDVFMPAIGKMFKNDGRSQSNPLSQYGTGGLMLGKKYMLSLTYNAPKEAFNNKNQYLFEGRSVDEAFFHSTAQYKFCGYDILPAFVCFDVIKNPNFETYKSEIKAHLDKHILGN
jgi:modulator of drug activity B